MGRFFKTAQFSAILSHPIPTTKLEKWVGPICCSYMRCDFESELTWNHFFRQHHEFDSCGPTAKLEKWVGPICCLYMRCDFELHDGTAFTADSVQEAGQHAG